MAAGDGKSWSAATRGPSRSVPLSLPTSHSLFQPHGTFSRGTREVDLPRLGGRYDGDFKDLIRVLQGEKELEFSYDHDLAVQKAVLEASGLSLE